MKTAHESEIEWAKQQFIEGFAFASGLNRRDAEEHWDAFSRQLPHTERCEIEIGGHDVGLTNGWLWCNL
jgi:hypothetical protein